MAYSLGFGDWDCVETHTESDIQRAMELERQREVEKWRVFYLPSENFQYRLYNLCKSGICEICGKGTEDLYKRVKVKITSYRWGYRKREIIASIFGHKDCIQNKGGLK